MKIKKNLNYNFSILKLLCNIQFIIVTQITFSFKINIADIKYLVQK